MQKYNENQLQRSLHNLISDPSKILKSAEGNRLQILSPGSLNLFEGPDFKEAAILINGIVRVGDIEFHRNASEWDNHNHSDDENFQNVILHIVCNNNKEIEHSFQTLVIREEDIISNFTNLHDDEKSISVISLEELQDYALIRLLRKTASAKKVLNKNTIYDTLLILTKEYILRYNSKRRRPAYTDERLKKIIEKIEFSLIKDITEKVNNHISVSIPDSMAKLIKTKIYDEGPHLRREIILNSILPLLLCIADEKSRIDLFLWFWSTSALNQYGILKRKFPDIPQNYIWQQQGMLEYINLHGQKKSIVAESIKTYGFAQILGFYKLGNAPFQTTETDK